MEVILVYKPTYNWGAPSCTSYANMVKMKQYGNMVIQLYGNMAITIQYGNFLWSNMVKMESHGDMNQLYGKMAILWYLFEHRTGKKNRTDGVLKWILARKCVKPRVIGHNMFRNTRIISGCWHYAQGFGDPKKCPPYQGVCSDRFIFNIFSLDPFFWGDGNTTIRIFFREKHNVDTIQQRVYIKNLESSVLKMSTSSLQKWLFQFLNVSYPSHGRYRNQYTPLTCYVSTSPTGTAT